MRNMRKMRMYLNLMHVWPQHLLPLTLPRTQSKLHTNNCRSPETRGHVATEKSFPVGMWLVAGGWWWCVCNRVTVLCNV